MHTPGPWTAYNKIGNRILQTWRVGSESTEQPCGICKLDESLTGDQEVANARLIAQAPTMLDLLTESLMYVEECEEFHKESCRTLSNRIRAAIKAINPTR